MQTEGASPNQASSPTLGKWHTSSIRVLVLAAAFLEARSFIFAAFSLDLAYLRNAVSAMSMCSPFLRPCS